MKQLYYSLIFIFTLLIMTGCGGSRRSAKSYNPSSAEGVHITAYGPNAAYNRYIEMYAATALRNQRQYGIPASITLAQGLLESGAGGSTLASQHNNHFGIKCHRSWRGGRAYHTDDRPNECFRSYGDPADSYEDHANFLQQTRYKRLFLLNPTDYKGWAKGLQKAGYATDRGYANKLIKIIEDYQLYLIDNGNVGRNYVYNRPSQPKREVKKEAPIAKHAPTTPPTFQPSPTTEKEREIYISYGLLYVLADEGDTMSDIAQDVDISERKLTRYNELPEGYPLEKGDVVYLQKKLNRATPPYYEHVVTVGESIHDIAQRYGVQLKVIYKLNQLPGDYIPQEGDVLRLR